MVYTTIIQRTLLQHIYSFRSLSLIYRYIFSRLFYKDHQNYTLAVIDTTGNGFSDFLLILATPRLCIHINFFFVTKILGVW